MDLQGSLLMDVREGFFSGCGRFAVLSRVGLGFAYGGLALAAEEGYEGEEARERVETEADEEFTDFWGLADSYGCWAIVCGVAVLVKAIFVPVDLAAFPGCKFLLVPGRIES